MKINPSKILVLRLSSMGDVILTTPILRQLQSAFPDAKIDFITSSDFVEIFRFNPRINLLYSYNKNWSNNEIRQYKSELILNLNKKKYDFAIDLQKNFRSRFFINGLSKQIYSVYKNRFHKLSLVYLKKSLNYKNIYDLYTHNIKHLINDDDLGLELWLKKDYDAKKYLPFQKLFKETEPLIAFAPGAFHYTKRWLPENFVQLAKKIKSELKYDIMLLGGKQDKELCDYIASKVGFKIINYAGSNSIISTAENLDKVKALITNDTGVMHIAAARQVPIVAIFGSTVPEFGFAPFRCKHSIVQTALNCRPCTHIGRSECPKTHFKCMKDISVEMVYKELVRMVE